MKQKHVFWGNPKESTQPLCRNVG